MASIVRSLAPSGSLGVQVIRTSRPYQTVMEAIRDGLPKPGLAPAVLRYRRKNLRHLLRGAWRLRVAELVGAPTFFGSLAIKVFRRTGVLENLGVVSCRVVTDTGVGFLVDAWDNTVELEIMKYHGCGTGVGAEAAADAALGTESTTDLNPNSARATGTVTQPSANIMQSVGTLTFDGTVAVTEHGLFSQAATGGGVLFDRSTFTAVNVVSGDSIQFTYALTLTSGFVTRYAVYREELVGWVDQSTQILAYSAAEQQFGRTGRIIRVQAAGASDSDERTDRETEKFGYWKAEQGNKRLGPGPGAD